MKRYRESNPATIMEVEMKKIESDAEILDQFLNPEGKTVVDVGCGTGGTVRLLASRCKRAIGLDSEEMIAKALQEKDIPGNIHFQEGTAQDLPFPDESVDILIYFASFHHVPEDLFDRAMTECRRVLKNDGTALFIEPVARPGSYYEITRLTEDEAEIQKAAEKVIKNAHRWQLQETDEAYFYLERSFESFK
jgi:ubiquinone/menaquinone biosynthesis C-methylase UbiE